MKSDKNNFRETLLFILGYGASLFATVAVLTLLIFTIK